MTGEIRFLVVGNGDVVHRIGAKYAEFAVCGEYIKDGEYGEPTSIPMRSLHILQNNEICPSCKYDEVVSWG